MESTRPPRFLGNPCVHATLFDPGGPLAPCQYGAGDAAFRSENDVGSATLVSFRGSIARPAPSLCTLRRWPRDQLRNTRFRAVASLSRRRTLTCWVPLESFRHALLHGFPFLQALPGAISAETSRRIACDASVVRMTHDVEGNTLDVGRKTRAIPLAIRRALVARDVTCRFPGCHNRFVQGHHLKHWANGDETKLDNLCNLCHYHHHLVHDGGYRIEVPAGGQLAFYRPNGARIPEVHPPPELPDNPIETLRQQNRDRGLEITDKLGKPKWGYEPLQLDYLIWATFANREVRRREATQGNDSIEKELRG